MSEIVLYNVCDSAVFCALHDQLNQNQYQKWFNKDATDVHQPITVIQNDMALLYSKKIKKQNKNLSV